MIDFYYAPTPNGWKVAIMLFEANIEHRTILMRLAKGDQFTPAFLAINPNAKMPAIVDHDGEGAPVNVFESGSILLYLAEKVKRFAPTDVAGKRELLQWLFWQAASQGPMAGQLSHFVNYAPKGHDYSLNRYKGEYERNLGVLEHRLQTRDYVMGDYSIADMMIFPWVFIAKPLSVSLEAFPKIVAWRQAIKTRPAVQQAIDLFKGEQNTGKTSAEENSLLFNQTAAHLEQFSR
ncbi:MAG: glutathione binding-like protein [Stappiaceae bacterium]